MNYKIGQLLSLGQKDIKYELLSYQGEYRRNSNLSRIFPVPKSQITEDGREHAYYEVWECLNLNTGIIETKKLPVYVFVETGDEYVNGDRREVIDDTDEVTSLLDSYDCWYNGRNRKNFHLDIINDRHIEHISKLRELDSQKLDDNYKVGIRLKLIQKEHPNSVTRRMFLQWETEFPDLSLKLKNYVYKINVSNNANNTI